MIVLGIDIGLTGAVAAVGANSAAVRDIPTVDDGKTRRICGKGLLAVLREFVPPGEPALVVFEDVRARPAGNAGAHGNSMHSQGSLMRSRGIVEAVLDIARVKVHVVQPQTWKRHFALLKAEKARSRECAVGLFPGIAHDLKRVKDHNRAEALLMAQFGKDTLA